MENILYMNNSIFHLVAEQDIPGKTAGNEREGAMTSSFLTLTFPYTALQRQGYQISHTIFANAQFLTNTL